MTRHQAIDDILAEAASLHARSDHDGALSRARDGLARAPDAPELLRLMLRAHLALGADAAAAELARRLAAMPGQPDALEILVEAALATGALQAARAAVSEAEAAGTRPEWQVAHFKARIAMAAGDLLAARAILVMAIERRPDAAPLRALLAEAMVAAGTASDARAVLGHLGQPPTEPLDPAAPDDGSAAEDEEDRPGSKIS